MMSKYYNTIYLNDSSDEDERYDKYTLKGIYDNILSGSYFTSSYILAEIAQSILESPSIKLSYNKVKAQTRNQLQKDLVNIGSKIDISDLHSKLGDKYIFGEYLMNFKNKGLVNSSLRKYLCNVDLKEHYYDSGRILSLIEAQCNELSILFNKLKSEYCNNLLNIDYEQRKKYTSDIANYLKSVAGYANSTENIKKLSEIIVDNITSLSLSTKLTDLTDSTVFKGYASKLRLLSLDQVLKEVSINLAKEYLPAYIASTLDKCAYELFLAEVLKVKMLDSEYIGYRNAVFLEAINEENLKIIDTLKAYRPTTSFKEDSVENFVNFKLDHRITKGDVKTNVFFQKSFQEDIAYILPENFTVSETRTIKSGGTRGNYVHINQGQGGSYQGISDHIKTYNNIAQKDLAILMKTIIGGKSPSIYKNVIKNQGEYLCQIANLVFKLEPERNVSAFLTNAMFFELVEGGIYSITDLASKMPMAMTGAIQASRYTLDVLGGKYGDKTVGSLLTKREFFDYKNTSYLQLETQQHIKEKLLHYELTFKDAQILHDWLLMKYKKPLVDITQLSKMIEILNITNEIVDSNYKLPGALTNSTAEEKLSLIKERFLEFTDLEALKATNNLKDALSVILNYVESQRNNIFQEISKLYVNQDNFILIVKAIHDLVKDWYKLDLDYLLPKTNTINMIDIKKKPDGDKIEDSLIKSQEIFKDLSKEERQKLLEIIKKEYGLNGSDLKKESNIGWINSYFSEYTLDALNNILDLRLKDLWLKNIPVFKGIFIDQDTNNIIELLSSIMDTKAQTILVPLNLFNKHAIGMIFEKATADLIKVKYLDPENKPIPVHLEQIFKDYGLNIEQVVVEQQKYSNCAPKVIEDFILYLTGSCLSQEEAIPFHSYLVEQDLLYPKSYEIVELSGCSD